MDRARSDGAAGAGLVVDDADRHDLLAVAVGDLEDGAGDVSPGPDGSGAGAIVGAAWGIRPQHAEDSLVHIAREGQSTQLVVHDRYLRKAALEVGFKKLERLNVEVNTNN